ncbi:tetratricopeptide repeat protein [Streptomyces sp. Je 1-369]|uniref:tetratricopeptide repeat protein n=1 Tax=Streptomyces sp. Je 1-369 TaxID=2966192 RepID=UPI0022861EAD|nr:tetratricopeptide repeat protein [Streptomyces sp. Je 1-369]
MPKDGARWATVILLDTLAFAGVFVLFYATRVPLLPAAEEGRIAVGVAAATVVATIGGTAGAAWVGRAVVDSAHIAAPRPDPESGPEPSPTDVLVRMGELPVRPRGFQPREDLLAGLQQAADEPGLTVVHAVTGARGVGKTQLAAAYARRRIVEGWPVVAWIAAESGGRLASGLAELADRLGVRAPGDDVAAAARASLGWIGAHPDLPCLIVVDNATDPDEVAAWLPVAGRAQVVVTTTVRSFGNIAGALVDVDVFTEEEALDFLRERSECGSPDGAAELAAELGCLPLALAQAAEVIRGRGVGYRGYLERLRAYPVREVLARAPGDRYPHRVGEAILLAVEGAEGRRGDGLVRVLLDALSVLSPDGVPRELLAGAVGGRDPGAVDDVLGALVDASLITRVGGDAVAVHRLVQRVLRERARQEGTLDRAAHLVVEYLDDRLVPSVDAWRLRERGRQLADQIEALWSALRPEVAARGAGAMEPLIDLRRWVAAEHLVEVGDLARALREAREIVAVCDAAPDAAGPVTVSALDTLGDVCARAGRVTEAVTVRRRRLELLEAAADPDEREVCLAREDLADACRAAGSFEPAVSLYETVVRDAERLFGPQHAVTLSVRGHLARSYAAAGRLADAIALSERLRSELTERVRADASPGAAPDSARELWPWRTLADAYGSAGRAEEGVSLLRQFLAERVQAEGEDAPETVHARHALALNCISAGRYDEALTEARRAAADAVRVFGDVAEDTADIRDTVALCLLRLDHDEEAIDLHRRIVADLTELLGPDHRGVLSARLNLARALDKGLHESESYQVHRDVLADCTRLLGPDHPDTLEARAQYIDGCASVGRTAEAVAMAREVLADAEAVFGPTHRRVLAIRLDLAAVLVVEGRGAEAVTLLRRALVDTTRALGAGHPQALRVRAHLARALSGLGRWTESCALREENVTELTRLYGEDDVEAVRSRGALAVSYGECGRYEEALALHRRVLDDMMRLRGSDHGETLMARRSLAWAHETLWRYPEQAELLKESLAESLRVYGVDHPVTLAVRGEYASALARMAKWREMRRAARGLHASYLRILGPDHPYTVNALSRAAYLLRRRQRRIRALTVRRRVLAAYERHSGPLSGEAVAARRSLGAAYVSVGLVWKNVTLQRRLLDDLTEEFGPGHPWTLAQRNWWATSALRHSGRWREALTVMRELVADYERLHGPEHRWTLEARLELGRMARRTGRGHTAVTELAALVADHERLHGPDHAWTWLARTSHAYALLWSLHPRRAGDRYGVLLHDATRIFGPRSLQVRTVGRRYVLLCLGTGRWNRLREALRILRGE